MVDKARGAGRRLFFREGMRFCSLVLFISSRLYAEAVSSQRVARGTLCTSSQKAAQGAMYIFERFITSQNTTRRHN